MLEDQEAKANKLQQLLEEGNERREADARKHSETYGRILYLESSLAAVQRGEPIEEHTPADRNRPTALEEVTEPRETALIGPQSDGQRLEQQSLPTHPDRDGYEAVVATLERVKAAAAEESNEDLLATLEILKKATAGETTETSNKTLSRNVVGMVHRIVDSRERLARKEEVLESVISSQPTVPARRISRLPPAAISTSRRSSRIPTTADFEQ